MDTNSSKYSSIHKDNSDNATISLAKHEGTGKSSEIENNDTNIAQEKLATPSMKSTSKGKRKRPYKYW